MTNNCIIDLSTGSKNIEMDKLALFPYSITTNSIYTHIMIDKLRPCEQKFLYNRVSYSIVNS